MRTWLKKRNVLIAVLLLTGAAVITAAVASLRWIARRRDPGPTVVVSSYTPEDQIHPGQSVIIRGRALHPDGVIEGQLWINGDKISAQKWESAPDEINIHFAWQPRSEGTYQVTLKATSVHGVIGSSRPVLQNAVVQTDGSSPGSRNQIIMQEGDTPLTVAEELDIDIEELEIPDSESELEAGGSLFTREIPEEETDPDEPPVEISPEGDLPLVEPVEPVEDPTPTGGDSSGVPFWTSLPGLDLLCAALPEACGGGPDTGIPEKPSNVTAFPLSDSCSVSIDWIDQADNELGFRIYRVEPGVTVGLEYVGKYPASPGTGSHLTYLDEHAGRGRFTYFVQAYNAAGHVYMPASDEIETRCDETYPGEKIPLVVEAVRLQTNVHRDQMYCYVALGRGYLERVPTSYGEFIELEPDGSGNIAEYFAGKNSRRIMVDRKTDLHIRGRCNVRESYSALASFSETIPPEHWDGREIPIGPGDGSYLATIRVHLSTEAEGETALIDPDLPPPTNLRQVESWEDCTLGFACLSLDLPGLAWDYPADLEDYRPFAFQVYRRSLDRSTLNEVFYSVDPARSAPLFIHQNCGVGAFYSVNAITDIRDPVTGQPIESPPSEEIKVTSECVDLTVTLISLQSYKMRDHCPGLRCKHQGQMYGQFWIGDTDIFWNFHCHREGCLVGDIPSTTHFTGDEFNLSWRYFYLNHGDGFAVDNNTFTVRIPAARGLTFNWEFKEHDKVGGDDNWCAYRNPYPILEGNSPGDWDNLDETFYLESEDGDCGVHFRITGPSG